MNPRVTAIVSMVSVAALAATYYVGVRTGRDQDTHNAVVAALDTNARQLRAAEAHQDTTKHAAVALTVHVDSERVQTRAIEDAVTIVAPDSVQVTTADSIVRAGVPALVVTELELDRAQILDDSLTIDKWIANDSAQMNIITRLDERTQLLEGQVRTESHAAFWRGLKIGAIATAIVALVLHGAH